MMTILKNAGQILLLLLLSTLGNFLSRQFTLIVPGSMIGALLLFLALKCKLLPLEWIEGGASYLLANLLLFFVPSAVGIVQYKQLLSSAGTGLFITIFTSTIAVMGW